MNNRPTFQVGEREASPVWLEGTGCSSANRPIRVVSRAVHEQLRGGRAPLLTVIEPLLNGAAEGTVIALFFGWPVAAGEAIRAAITSRPAGSRFRSVANS